MNTSKLFILINTESFRRSYLNPDGSKVVATIMSTSPNDALASYNTHATNCGLTLATRAIEAATGGEVV